MDRSIRWLRKHYKNNTGTDTGITGTDTGKAKDTGKAPSPIDYAAGKIHPGPLPSDATLRQEATEAMAQDQAQDRSRNDRVQTVSQAYYNDVNRYKDLVNKVPVEQLTGYSSKFRKILDEFVHQQSQTNATKHYPSFGRSSRKDKKNQPEIEMRIGAQKLADLITEMTVAARDNNVKSLQKMQTDIQKFLQNNDKNSEIEQYAQKYQAIQTSTSELQKEFEVAKWDQYADEVKSLHQDILKQQLEKQWNSAIQPIQTYVRKLLDQITDPSLRTQYEARFQGLQTKFQASSNFDQWQDILLEMQNVHHQMTALHKDLVQETFKPTQAPVRDLLERLKDNEGEQTRYNALIRSYQQLLSSQHSGQRQAYDRIEAESSSSYDQRSQMKPPHDSTPHQWQKALDEMTALHKDLVQKVFDQTQASVRDLLEGLEDNEDKRTRYNNALRTYQLISGQRQTDNRIGAESSSSHDQRSQMNSTPHQWQKALNEMTALHKELIQETFKPTQASVRDLLKDIKDPQLKTTYQNELEDLQRQHQASSNFNQWQDVHHQMTALHNQVTQRCFEQIKELFQKLMQNIEPSDLKTASQARYDGIIQRYQKLSPDNSSTTRQWHSVLSDIRDVHEELVDMRYRSMRVFIQQLLERIEQEPEFSEEESELSDVASDANSRAQALEETSQEAPTVLASLFDKKLSADQRKEIYDNMTALDKGLVRQVLERFKRKKNEFSEEESELSDVASDDGSGAGSDVVSDDGSGDESDVASDDGSGDESDVASDEGSRAETFEKTSQRKHTVLASLFEKDLSAHQRQRVLDEMTILHKELVQWHFEWYEGYVDDLLNQIEDTQSKIQHRKRFEDLKTQYQESSNPDQLQKAVDDLLDLHRDQAQKTFEQTEKYVQALLGWFKIEIERYRYISDGETEHYGYKASFHDIQADWAKKPIKPDQLQGTVEDLLDLHRSLVLEIFKWTQASVEKLIQTMKESDAKQIKTDFDARAERYRKLSPDQSTSDQLQKAVEDLPEFHRSLVQKTFERTNVSVQKIQQIIGENGVEQKTQIDYDVLIEISKIYRGLEPKEYQYQYKLQKAVDDLLDFHKDQAQRTFDQIAGEVQQLLGSFNLKQESQSSYQNRIAKLQTQLNSSDLDRKEDALRRMTTLHSELQQTSFRESYKYIQQNLNRYVEDYQLKTEYSNQAKDLQQRYKAGLNLTIQQWQQGRYEIVQVQSLVYRQAWKEQFGRLHTTIKDHLQDLQDSMLVGQYEKAYQNLQDKAKDLFYEESGEITQEMYNTQNNEMLSFDKNLVMANEMNRQLQNMRDYAKETGDHGNELEEILRELVHNATKRKARVWSEQNDQGQSITYADFTDPEGHEHLKQEVEVVNGTDTKTHKAIEGYYCLKTQNFISHDLQTIYKTQLINEGQQLKLADVGGTSWEQDLHTWSKPIDLDTYTKLERAKREIWQALSQKGSPTEPLELSLNFHGSHLSKTTITTSDADIHVAFNSGTINNPYQDDDLPKYREILKEALIRAFTKGHVKKWDEVITINEKAFGLETDLFPAFYYTQKGKKGKKGKKGIVSYTDNQQILIHFIEEKRLNAQKKSENTAYRFRHVIRVLKHARNALKSSKNKNVKEIAEIPSFILESLVYNTPDKYLADTTSGSKPKKRKLADTLDRVLAYCIEHTANDEACKDWKEVDGIKYLFNFSENKPWEKEIKGVTYRYSGKHDITREKVHEFLRQLERYVKLQKVKYVNIELSHPLVGDSYVGTE